MTVDERLGASIKGPRRTREHLLRKFNCFTLLRRYICIDTDGHIAHSFILQEFRMTCCSLTYHENLSRVVTSTLRASLDSSSS